MTTATGPLARNLSDAWLAMAIAADGSSTGELSREGSEVAGASQGITPMVSAR